MEPKKEHCQNCGTTEDELNYVTIKWKNKEGSTTKEETFIWCDNCFYGKYIQSLKERGHQVHFTPNIRSVSNN